jgi:hypothetical protein
MSDEHRDNQRGGTLFTASAESGAGRVTRVLENMTDEELAAKVSEAVERSEQELEELVRSYRRRVSCKTMTRRLG